MCDIKTVNYTDSKNPVYHTGLIDFRIEVINFQNLVSASNKDLETISPDAALCFFWPIFVFERTVPTSASMPPPDCFACNTSMPISRTSERSKPDSLSSGSPDKEDKMLPIKSSDSSVPFFFTNVCRPSKA